MAAPAGLSSREAAERLLRHGPNEPVAGGRRSAVAEVAVVLLNPLALVLLAACAVSAVLGERVDAVVIALMVLLGAGLDLFQTHRSRRAADRLRASVTPTATALRDGAWSEVPRRTLVPGDVIRLTAGDLVPADARLVEARDLHVQEAALTGESLPVEKEVVAGAGAPDVHLGTSVVSGYGVAEVVATGPATAFGAIAARLVIRPPETAFERGLRQFGLLVTSTVLFLVLFIVVASVALHRDAMESLLFAVALAVGLTPEFLPMVTTVTLAQGAVRMSRARVIVKHLAAIQNLGGMDVLCCDKTGTLTVGTLRLDRALDPAGAPSGRVLQLAARNSRFESGIRSPLDQAILEAAPAEEGWVKLDEVPFDFERRRLSVVVERDGVRELVVKGAPEGVLGVAVSREEGDTVRPLDGADRERCLALYRQLGEEGFRVLAVARRPVEGEGPFSSADERDLVLCGFLAFADPPQPDAGAAIADLRRDGVVVKVVTGDNERVARHVCTQVGIDPGEVVLGEELDHMGDTALQHVAETATVFARTTPAQKTRILLALKRRGHAVGFLGDGINDAPSLHAADVGISVPAAAEVARDAAEVILLDRSLRVLHTGVREGRKAVGNVMKYLLMGTSSNFGNVLSMAGAALFLPFLPMLPTQILVNNFLYDVAQLPIPVDRVEPEWLRQPRRWDVGRVRRFMLLVGPVSSLYDFLTFFVLLRFFHAPPELFRTGWFVESLATQTLVVLVIRTSGNPFRSRPAWPLVLSVLGVVLLGGLLPLSPVAARLGFTPLPAAYVAFVAVSTATYLVLVEAVKRVALRPEVRRQPPARRPR